MARTFQREAIDGGDTGRWATPELTQNRLSLGINTIQLYDDSGTLKATVGKIGIQDNSINGVCHNTAIETISLTSVTNSNWFKVEIQRSGSSFTFVASDINTGTYTDPTEVPSDFDDAYDPEKGGYYINANYRTIAIGYVDGSGNLKGIINTKSIIEGYYGRTYTSSNNLKIEKTLDKVEYMCFCEDVGSYDLPSIVDNYGKVYTIYNSGDYLFLVDSDGAETINGVSGGIYLYSENDYIKVVAREDEWKILDYKIVLDSGWINRSDWTNVHIGIVYVDYDNLSGTFQEGEIVTESVSGNTGIILGDTGTTLRLVRVTGGGIFTNNRVLTGSISGATANVDEAGTGSTKDLDSNIFHKAKLNISKLKVKLYHSTDGDDDNSVEVPQGMTLNATGFFGWILRQESQAQAQIQTATNGILLIATNGTEDEIVADDDYYRIIVEFIY